MFSSFAIIGAGYFFYIGMLAINNLDDIGKKRVAVSPEKQSIDCDRQIYIARTVALSRINSNICLLTK